MLKSYVIDPLLLLLGLFVGCSLVGWASLIWAGQPITAMRITAGVIISGAVGVMVALLLWGRLADHDMGLLAGVSLLAGAGGTSTLDVLTAALLKIIRDRAGLKSGTQLAAFHRPENNDNNYHDND